VRNKFRLNGVLRARSSEARPMRVMPELSAHRLEPAESASSIVSASARKSIYYYRRTGAMAFAAVLSLGLIAAVLLPAKYRSEAKLLALTSDYYDVQTRSSDSKAEAFKPEEVVNLEMQLLSSHDLHREALRRIAGTPANSAELERERDAFTSSLLVTKASDANVIDLAFTAKDPARARAALDQLIAVYQQSRARLLLSGEVSQLTQQRDAARAELAKANNALQTFQQEHGVADIDAQIAGAVTVDTALRQRFSDTDVDLSGARGSLARLRASAGRVPETIELFRDDTEASRGIAEMQNQILQLEAKRADLAGRYMAGSPLIVQVDKQILALRQAAKQQSGQLQTARRTGRNAAYDAAVGQLRDGDAASAGNAAKRTQLTRELASSATRLQTLNGLAANIADLKLTREVAQDRYRRLARQVDDARARAENASTGGSNVRLIQAPNLPIRRSNPAWLIVAGAFIAALVISVVALFLRAIGRTVILDKVEAARDAGAPVIADLRTEKALLTGFGEAGRSDISAWIAALPRTPESAGCVIAFVPSNPRVYDDLCRSLRHELEGAGPCAVSLAIFGNVADGIDPDEAKRFQQTLLNSLSDNALVEINEQTWRSDPAAAKRIAMLRRAGRYVLMIVPPIALRDEEPSPSERLHAQIAATADQVVLLARTECTHRTSLRGLTALLTQFGRPPAGVILSGRRLTWPRYVTSAA
jgi:uncharacterized protein involved in exopolysaccharide biosynthesis